MNSLPYAGYGFLKMACIRLAEEFGSPRVSMRLFRKAVLRYR
jgi:hypothetical protein